MVSRAGRPRHVASARRARARRRPRHRTRRAARSAALAHRGTTNRAACGWEPSGGHAAGAMNTTAARQEGRDPSRTVRPHASPRGGRSRPPRMDEQQIRVGGRLDAAARPARSRRPDASQSGSKAGLHAVGERQVAPVVDGRSRRPSGCGAGCDAASAHAGGHGERRSAAAVAAMARRPTPGSDGTRDRSEPPG